MLAAAVLAAVAAAATAAMSAALSVPILQEQGEALHLHAMLIVRERVEEVLSLVRTQSAVLHHRVHEALELGQQQRCQLPYPRVNPKTPT